MEVGSAKKYHAVIMSDITNDVEEYQFGIDRVLDIKEDIPYRFQFALNKIASTVYFMEYGETIYFQPDNNPNSKAILKRIK